MEVNQDSEKAIFDTIVLPDQEILRQRLENSGFEILSKKPQSTLI